MKCPSCGYENSDDARYCNLCQTSFVKDQRELPELLAQRREAVSGGEATGLNWFQRHLNWTWLLATWTVSLLHFVVSTSFAASVVYSFVVDSPVSAASFVMSAIVINIIFTVLYLIASFGIGAWVLRRKQRSLWWLSMLVVPAPLVFVSYWLGVIASLIVTICFLFLENRSELPPVPVSNPTRPGLGIQGLKSQSENEKYWW